MALRENSVLNASSVFLIPEAFKNVLTDLWSKCSRHAEKLRRNIINQITRLMIVGEGNRDPSEENLEVINTSPIREVKETNVLTQILGEGQSPGSHFDSTRGR